MQGGVLIFHTRAITWGLGLCCLVKFSACVVVKAIYYYLSISERDGVRTGNSRRSSFQFKVSPTGKTNRFPPILLEGNVSTFSSFKVEHSLKMVKEKSIRIIKVQVSSRLGVEIKADSNYRVVFPHFIGGECLHFEYFQSGAFLENGPRKTLRIFKAQISPRWGVGIKADSIVRFYESLIFTAKFNHDEVLN